MTREFTVFSIPDATALGKNGTKTGGADAPFVGTNPLNGKDAGDAGCLHGAFDRNRRRNVVVRYLRRYRLVARFIERSLKNMRRTALIKTAKWGCLGIALVPVALVALSLTFLNWVPRTYPPVSNPIPSPSPEHSPGGGLDGFDSPYLGHTGSWDGKGGGLWGSSKTRDMDAEAGMGLRWTFMPVYWKAMEPKGPVDLSDEIPPAWKELDAFVVEAHQRGLNVLMQAPVMGGNAGGPPAWAGRREAGKSAPADMEAAAAFAAKLATRYAPGGTLAAREGWQQRYGVRAWELDNEPNGYLTHWKGQAADYAEFVTKVAAAIRRVDSKAVIIGPAANISSGSLSWIESALDAPAMRGSPEFRKRGRSYSIGPALDVVSFHIYEGLDTAFAGHDRTIEVAFSEIRQVFERWQDRVSGFAYSPKQDYWQTEGNFGFLFSPLSREQKAAWRVQFMTRAFAAGIRKVMVMDASTSEQTAVRTYVQALPNPFPMERADRQADILSGAAAVFCHADGTNSGAGRVWVMWSEAGKGDSEVAVPCIRKQVKVIRIDTWEAAVTESGDRVVIHLRGDPKMAPPVLLIDRAGPPPTSATPSSSPQP